jgi:hypothetical protein
MVGGCTTRDAAGAGSTGAGLRSAAPHNGPTSKRPSSDQSSASPAADSHRRTTADRPPTPLALADRSRSIPTATTSQRHLWHNGPKRNDVP